MQPITKRASSSWGSCSLLSQVTALRSIFISPIFSDGTELVVVGEANGVLSCHIRSFNGPGGCQCALLWRIQQDDWGPINFVVSLGAEEPVGGSFSLYAGCGRGSVVAVNLFDGVWRFVGRYGVGGDDAPLCGAGMGESSLVCGFASGVIRIVSVSSGLEICAAAIEDVGCVTSICCIGSSVGIGTDGGAVVFLDESLRVQHCAVVRDAMHRPSAILCLVMLPCNINSVPNMIASTESGNLYTVWLGGESAPASWDSADVRPGGGRFHDNINHTARGHSHPVTGMAFVPALPTSMYNNTINLKASGDSFRRPRLDYPQYLVTTDVSGLVCYWDWAQRALVWSDESTLGMPLVRPIVSRQVWSQCRFVSVRGELFSAFAPLSHLNGPFTLNASFNKTINDTMIRRSATTHNAFRFALSVLVRAEEHSRNVLEGAMLEAVRLFLTTVSFYDEQLRSVAASKLTLGCMDICQGSSPICHSGSPTVDRTLRRTLSPPPREWVCAGRGDESHMLGEARATIRRLEDALIRHQREAASWASVLDEERRREVGALRAMLGMGCSAEVGSGGGRAGVDLSCAGEQLHQHPLESHHVAEALVSSADSVLGCERVSESALENEKALRLAEEDAEYWRFCYLQMDGRRRKLLADVHAIRKPWEELKASASEWRHRAEALESLFAAERESLEVTIEELTEQVAILKGVLREGASWD